MTHPTPGLSEADKALREQLAASLLDRPGRHAQIIAYKKADELMGVIAAARAEGAQPASSPGQEEVDHLYKQLAEALDATDHLGQEAAHNDFRAQVAEARVKELEAENARLKGAISDALMNGLTGPIADDLGVALRLSRQDAPEGEEGR